MKRWLREQKEFITEFSTFCGIALLIILAGFGPIILAGGVFKYPVWLLLYIPVIAIVLQINQDY
jgi:hypothetical protein